MIKKKVPGISIAVAFIMINFWQLINMQESDPLWKKIGCATSLVIFLGLAIVGLLQKKQAA